MEIDRTTPTESMNKNIRYTCFPSFIHRLTWYGYLLRLQETPAKKALREA